MTDDAIIVFTFKTTETLLRDGGTSSWRLDRSHARRCTYAVCTRNAFDERTQGIPDEAHHAAFLVGKIHDVVPVGDRKRYLIQFSEYAEVSVPEVWKGDRNPVRYGTMEELGIDPTTLDWKPLDPSRPPADPTPDEPSAPEAGAALTMAEAKRGLALTFGVPVDAIEITIRG